MWRRLRGLQGGVERARRSEARPSYGSISMTTCKSQPHNYLWKASAPGNHGTKPVADPCVDLPLQSNVTTSKIASHLGKLVTRKMLVSINVWPTSSTSSVILEKKDHTVTGRVAMKHWISRGMSTAGPTFLVMSCASDHCSF